MDKALAAHRAGRLEDAVRGYGRVLAKQARHPEALFMRGTAWIQLGDPASAVTDLRAAVAARPGFAKAYNNLGIALAALGDTEQAVLAYDRALQAEPDYCEAAYNQGNAWVSAARPDEAVGSFRRAVALDPGHVGARIGLGESLMELGEHPEGMAALNLAVDLAGDSPDAHLALGNGLRQEERAEAAEAAYRTALSLRPGWATALNNLGAALHDQGRVRKAAGFYARAVQAKPGYAEAWVNLGNAQCELGEPAEAELAYRKAIELRADDPRAWTGLGNARTDRGAVEPAAKAYRHAAELAPTSARVLAGLASALRRTGDLAGAIDAAQRSLGIDPQQPQACTAWVQSLQHACDWGGLREAMAHPALAEAESPFLSVTLFDDPARNLRAARRRSANVEARAAGLAAQLEPVTVGPRERLRVGYLSADLHGHATAHLMAGLFARHDRDAVEVCAYSYGPDDGSEWRQRIVAGCDRFVDIAGLGPGAAAIRIAQDEVDILVDLKGHTENARPAILALRPAPVQVAWLGFPGSTGARFIDYALTDGVVTPPGADDDWTEALVRLPGCYQVNDADQRIGPPTSRADHGLPGSGFVFCSFNQPYKIEEAAWRVWMELLKTTPDSVLWLLAGRPLAHDNLWAAAAAAGVGRERIVFAPPAPKPEHLARIRLADLGLDTFTVNGHTTTSDALFAGAPVVTLQGPHFASRVASSILLAAGLPELVTTSADEYAARASEFAQDPTRLADVRARLCDRDKVSIFDTDAFARKLEFAYRSMWDQALSGQPPKKIDFAQIAIDP